MGGWDDVMGGCEVMGGSDAVGGAPRDWVNAINVTTGSRRQVLHVIDLIDFMCEETASGFRPESAHEIDDQGNHEEQANSAATENGAAKIKSAATEQKEKHNQNE